MGAAAALAGAAGWTWLRFAGTEGGLAWPLRRVLEFDERLSRGLFGADRLAPEFPASAAEAPRPNGSHGLAANVDAARWRLSVPGLRLTIDEIKALPRTAMTTAARTD